MDESASAPHAVEAKVARVVRGEHVIDDGDMTLIRVLPQVTMQSLGPFVFFDHYRHRSRRGIGDAPHPHAGIEVLSYLVDGSVEHRDSMGFRDRLSAGDAQVIRAGRGMVHMETPLTGRHGMQLWVSLPPALKLAEPSYQSLRSKDVPELVTDQYRLRVLAGEVSGLKGPLKLSGGATFAHLELRPHCAATLQCEASLELGLYGLLGQASIYGTSVSVGDLAVLPGATHVRCEEFSGESAHVALLGGGPIEGEILFSGPFVMDTPERLRQAQRDYATGRMGSIDGNY